MPSYNFIPGLESFMEDTTNVDVSVEVNPAEEVEEAAAAAEDDAAIEGTAEAAESTAEQSEMILSRYMDLENQYFHIAKYGVDRTYMRLFNQNGELNSALRIKLPGCESFDTTGSRTSAESIACMEGLGNVLRSIWGFLNKVATKIGLFFKKIFNAIVSRIGKLSDNIARLKKINSNKPNDNIDALQNADEKVADFNAIKMFKDRIINLSKSEEWKEIDDYRNALMKKIKDATAVKESPTDAGSLASDTYMDLRSSEDKKNEEEEYNKIREKIDNKMDELEKAIPDSEGIEVKNVDRHMVDDYLDTASTAIASLENIKNSLAMTETKMKNLGRFADTMSRVYKKQAAGHTRRVQLLSAYSNLESRAKSKIVALLTMLIRRCIHAAGSRLKYAIA